METVAFRVNGREVTVTVPAQRTLLEVLREELDLTSAKEGCGKGECGTCTVIVDGEAVNSCLILVSQVQGREVLTLEGLAPEGRLDPVQEAFIVQGAIQCGYCTPGMVMSAKALLMKNPSPTREEIKRAIAGNLCRCTGYKKIIEAVEIAAKA